MDLVLSNTTSLGSEIKAKELFRNYTDSDRQDIVRNHYMLMRQVRRMRHFLILYDDSLPFYLT